MEARITFRSEIYIEGDTPEEIRAKWANMSLFSADALNHYADCIEIMYVEDEETGKEINLYEDSVEIIKEKGE